MKITVGPNQYVKESMYEQYQKWIGNDDIITDPITGIESISHDPLKDLLVDDLDSLKNEDAFELNAEGLDDGFDG